jgi:tetratricopeptide (TPR) repeat protein
MSDQDPQTQVELEEIPLDVANDRKQDGNDLFRVGKWEEAMTAYRSALGCLPKRTISAPVPQPARSDTMSDSDGLGEDVQTPLVNEEVIEVVSPVVGESEREMKKLRAVLNANIGACYLKLGNHKDAIDSCTQALLDDPNYVKALERRAACNDVLNTWSSLTSAQEDYNKLLSLVSAPSQLADLRKKLQALKPRIEVAQKSEMDEMLSKLKGLGNSLLGQCNELVNFKFVPNGQGGYSVNFQQ